MKSAWLMPRTVLCMNELTVTTRGLLGSEKQRQQARGEGEVPEMIGADLQLEPVGGLPVRRCHHARVVDQQVERLV